MRSWNAGESLLPRCRNGMVACHSGDGTPRSGTAVPDRDQCPGPSGSASSGATQRAEPFGELLIDREEDRTLRAALVGMLREHARHGR